MEETQAHPNPKPDPGQGQLIPIGDPKQLLLREAADVNQVGLEVVKVNQKSWTVRLNYHRHVEQDCRFDNWMIGPDARIRPRPEYVAKPGAYKSIHGPIPRLKLVRVSHGKPLPPPVPTPEDSLLGRLVTLERKIERIWEALGLPYA